MPIVRNYRLTVFSSTVIFFIASVSIYLFIIHRRSVAKSHTIDDESLSGNRLVWPEQLPFGDRMKDQINYVPEGYKYEKTPVKTILIYTGLGEDWEKPRLGQAEFFGCAVNQCLITVNRTLGPNVDAVLFRHSYSRPSFIRPPNQIWIMLHSEAPYSTKPPIDVDVFNWTSDYRWDSDIPFTSGYFLELKPKPPVWNLIKRNYAENKTKQVAWFVSNCNPNSNRAVYGAELAKHIKVDVYGACGTLDCPRSKENECFRMLDEQYKFYLAFENAHCRYYITEKFFTNALRRNILPIVLGPSKSDYELLAPKNSFIHVDDFESPKELAEYLYKLDQNDELYNEYFAWKGTGSIISDPKLFCRLCAMLHDKNHPPKHYSNYTEYWNGPGICRL